MEWNFFHIMASENKTSLRHNMALYKWTVLERTDLKL